jgi:hypothetical protein
VSGVHRRGFLRTAAAGVVPVTALTNATEAAPAPAVAGTTLPGPKGAGPELRRGPYLQAQGPDRVVVRWRTDGSAGDSRLRYGDSLEALDRTAAARLVPSPISDVEDWQVVVEGWSPHAPIITPWRPRRRSSPGADDEHYVSDAPARGKPAPARFWVLGDCGTNRVDSGNPGKAVAARNGFRKFNRDRGSIDGIILLGDNAYSHGTDAQYLTELFSVYGDELRKTPSWPCIVNHELTDDYFGIFTVPERGEVGGVPSGCTNYYSFDMRTSISRSSTSGGRVARPRGAPEALAGGRPGGLSAGLVVVVNHFPPYCAGKYESDHNALPRRRPPAHRAGAGRPRGRPPAHGHDHTYQRSYLIDGHYGARDTFDTSRHLRAEGDGRSAAADQGAWPALGAHRRRDRDGRGAAALRSLRPARAADSTTRRWSHSSTGARSRAGVRALGTFLLEIDGRCSPELRSMSGGASWTDSRCRSVADRAGGPHLRSRSDRSRRPQAAFFSAISRAIWPTESRCSTPAS